MNAGDALRGEIVRTCRRLLELGMERGTSGNVSARYGDAMLVTPSAVPYERAGPDDIAEVFDDGGYRGPLEPTSEWRLHREIYRAHPGARAIVHTHSMFATTVACTRKPIPAVHYYVALAGGTTIPCADYATFGSQRLAENAAHALKDRRACLLANHGLIAIGDSLATALKLAVDVETVATQYVRALAIGGPVILTDDEIAAAARRFATYGTHARGDPELHPID